MGVGKIAVPIVTTLLVVGIVIGVVAVVHSRSEEAEEAKKFNSPSMKMITTICEPTEYKASCASTLHSVANNASATPNDYIRAVVEAALQEVTKALAATGKVVVDKDKDKYNDQGAVEDCKHMLDYAIDLLQASISSVGDADLHTLQQRQHELLSWMTAVYSFQTTCTDDIRAVEYKSAVQNGMLNATQLTHNAVNVVATLSEMLKLFNVKISRGAASASQRRLLGVEEGFPHWLGAAERKLLGKEGLVPNVVVAKDGSGQYKSIKEAVQAYPKNFKGRFLIYVKAGVYNEKVIVDKKKANVFMYGDGIAKTIVTGKLSGKGGVKTMQTATFGT